MNVTSPASGLKKLFRITSHNLATCSEHSWGSFSDPVGLGQSRRTKVGIPKRQTMFSGP